ncbi:hypothetical protein [Mesomycoplasma hyopneumoniae]|uniref:hypothetical protein n=1 Tax=Mesomycoplasma hyopneumoniae TaxID=2099 RepID=UPI001314BB9F|nr:hypothetical protein [Mesomycoplasma hyopneumoniae]
MILYSDNNSAFIDGWLAEAICWFELSSKSGQLIIQANLNSFLLIRSDFCVNKFRRTPRANDVSW